MYYKLIDMFCFFTDGALTLPGWKGESIRVLYWVSIHEANAAIMRMYPHYTLALHPPRFAQQHRTMKLIRVKEFRAVINYLM